jgi:hypothetical protein
LAPPRSAVLLGHKVKPGIALVKGTTLEVAEFIAFNFRGGNLFFNERIHRKVIVRHLVNRHQTPLAVFHVVFFIYFAHLCSPYG